MYEQYKFKKMKEIIIHIISKNVAPIKVSEIYKVLSELNPPTISANLTKLHSEKLIKKNGGWKDKNTKLILNIKKIEAIKKIIGNHWDSDWEVDWKNVAKTGFL